MDPITGYRILIWSENPDELMTFYRDTLGLEESVHLDMPDDYGYGLKISEEFRIWIGKHSEVQGKNKDTFRHIINLYVDDVHAWFNKVKTHSEVQIIQEPIVTPPSRGSNDPKYVCTFLDPEGNCLQFMNPS